MLLFIDIVLFRGLSLSQKNGTAANLLHYFQANGSWLLRMLLMAAGRIGEFRKITQVPNDTSFTLIPEREIAHLHGNDLVLVWDFSD